MIGGCWILIPNPRDIKFLVSMIKKHRPSLLFCVPVPMIPVPVPGIPISFWEPARLVDVTKSPMCMVSLGGISLGTAPQRGMKDDKEGDAFYHVHYYIYPVIYWLELLMDFMCLEAASVDVAYLTEFDPLWNDDVKTTILNPEAILFGNPIAQGACIADCMAASAGLSLDALFWCSGCQGSMYPYTGTVSAQKWRCTGISSFGGSDDRQTSQRVFMLGLYGQCCSLRQIPDADYT